jgi:uncharacterized membrane protein
MKNLTTKFQEQVPRSLAKVITWRIIMATQYFLLGWWATGSIASGVGLAGITTVVNSFIYFFHERAWNLSNWGKQVSEQASDQLDNVGKNL